MQRLDGFFWEDNEEVDTSENREPQRPIVESPPRPIRPALEENASVAELPDLTKAGNAAVLNLVQPIPPRRRPYRFIALQGYEGTIEQVHDDEFVARLRDQFDTSEPIQEATIAIENVWESDRDLVAPGAIFYWSIGYHVEPHGQRTLASTIRFRRLPAWTSAELRRVKQVAASFDDFFTEA